VVSLAIVDLDALNPAQRRLVEELLQIDVPRPTGDRTLPVRIRERIESGIAGVLGAIPTGAVVSLAKSRLDALGCEGRFLDLLDSPFAWTVPIARGKLAHRAIEVDWATERGRTPREVVAGAWDRFLDGDPMGEFLTGLGWVEAADLRSATEQFVSEFRDLWPLIPSEWSPRLEPAVSQSFGGGAVSVTGRPDIVLGRVMATRSTMLVIDLKSGNRYPERERQDLRLYGLLLALRYGLAPFRWATYYLNEGAWDVEDVGDGAVLMSAADRVVDGVNRAVRLLYHRPVDAELVLVGGAHCRWCGRAPTCPAVATASDDY